MKPRARAFIALTCVTAGACSSDSARSTKDRSAEDALTLEFAIDAPVGGDQRECFGFDASFLSGRWLRRIAWTPPAGGPALHHATLFAVKEDFPAGPVVCDAMPNSLVMHVWAPGGDALGVPDGVGLAVPSGTKTLVVQAHVLRLAPGPSATASVVLETTASPPEHLAAWLPMIGGVPAIRPHTEEHSTTTCVASAPFHVWSAWPHMHLAGRSFQSAITHPDGSRSVLLRVSPWDFGAQRTYVVDQDLSAGDAVEIDCAWFNPTDQYVLPGLRTTDEMCGEGLIVWPAQAAAWQGDCR